MDIDNKEMFEKKQLLAEKFFEKNIILIYTDTSSSIFVVTDTMTSDDVVKLIKEEGFELSGTPVAGDYATSDMLKNGYWCFLK